MSTKRLVTLSLTLLALNVQARRYNLAANGAEASYVSPCQATPSLEECLAAESGDRRRLRSSASGGQGGTGGASSCGTCCNASDPLIPLPRPNLGFIECDSWGQQADARVGDSLNMAAAQAAKAAGVLDDGISGPLTKRASMAKKIGGAMGKMNKALAFYSAVDCLNQQIESTDPADWGHENDRTFGNLIENEQVNKVVNVLVCFEAFLPMQMQVAIQAAKLVWGGVVSLIRQVAPQFPCLFSVGCDSAARRAGYSQVEYDMVGEAESRHRQLLYTGLVEVEVTSGFYGQTSTDYVCALSEYDIPCGCTSESVGGNQDGPDPSGFCEPKCIDLQTATLAQYNGRDVQNQAECTELNETEGFSTAYVDADVMLNPLKMLDCHRLDGGGINGSIEGVMSETLGYSRFGAIVYTKDTSEGGQPHWDLLREDNSPANHRLAFSGRADAYSCKSGYMRYNPYMLIEGQDPDYCKFWLNVGEDPDETRYYNRYGARSGNGGVLQRGPDRFTYAILVDRPSEDYMPRQSYDGRQPQKTFIRLYNECWQTVNPMYNPAWDPPVQVMNNGRPIELQREEPVHGTGERIANVAPRNTMFGPFETWRQGQPHNDQQFSYGRYNQHRFRGYQAWPEDFIIGRFGAQECGQLDRDWAGGRYTDSTYSEYDILGGWAGQGYGTEDIGAWNVITSYTDCRTAYWYEGWLHATRSTAMSRANGSGTPAWRWVTGGLNNPNAPAGCVIEECSTAADRARSHFKVYFNLRDRPQYYWDDATFDWEAYNTNYVQRTYQEKSFYRPICISANREARQDSMPCSSWPNQASPGEYYSCMNYPDGTMTEDYTCRFTPHCFRCHCRECPSVAATTQCLAGISWVAETIAPVIETVNTIAEPVVSQMNSVGQGFSRAVSSLGGLFGQAEGGSDEIDLGMLDEGGSDEIDLGMWDEGGSDEIDLGMGQENSLTMNVTQMNPTDELYEEELLRDKNGVTISNQRWKAIQALLKTLGSAKQCECNYVGKGTLVNVQYLCETPEADVCYNLVHDWCAEDEVICKIPTGEEEYVL